MAYRYYFGYDQEVNASKNPTQRSSESACPQSHSATNNGLNGTITDNNAIQISAKYGHTSKYVTSVRTRVFTKHMSLEFASTSVLQHNCTFPKQSVLSCHNRLACLGAIPVPNMHYLFFLRISASSICVCHDTSPATAMNEVGRFSTAHINIIK